MERDDDIDPQDDLGDEDEVNEDEGDQADDDDGPGLERSGGSTFITGLIVGALVGAGIALLVAPDRGKVTRRRLKKFMRRVRDEARDQLDHWRSKAESQLARKRRELRQRLKEQA